MQLTARHREYWGKNLRITGLLLALWFFVTFVLLFFARDLTFAFFGWPFLVLGCGPGRTDRVLPDHLVLRTLYEQP